MNGQQICTQPLFLNLEKTKLLPEGHKDANSLYATPGTIIPASAAEEFGLVDGALPEKKAAKQKDGDPVQKVAAVTPDATADATPAATPAATTAAKAPAKKAPAKKAAAKKPDAKSKPTPADKEAPAPEDKGGATPADKASSADGETK